MNHPKNSNDPVDPLMLGAGAMIALLALGVALTLHNTRRVSEDAESVSHTHEVMDAVAEVRGRLRESEAVQRTFLIVGGDEVPPELEHDLTTAKTELLRLERLSSDNPEQLDRLLQIKQHVKQLGDLLSHTAQIRISYGFAAARNIVEKGSARGLMSKINELLRDMDNAERNLLQQRLVDRSDSYRWALIVGILSGLAGIAGLIAFIYLLRRYMAVRLAAAAEIAEQREWMATIVETSNDAILSKSLDGTIESWNAAAEQLLGYTEEEIVGQPVSLILPPGGQEEETQLIERISRGEPIEHYETQRKRKDGSLIDVSLTLSPVCDNHGNVDGASAIIRDISDRKRAERTLQESEERFRTLADNMSQFAWMADPEGWIFWYNQRWYDYTGTTLEDMQGWGWRKVHHPDHIERVVKRIQRSWDTGEVWEDLFPLRSKTGEYRWFLSRALPIRSKAGEILRWLGTNTDVTEQREAEEALREADRRKNEFLAMLAHELRNPLAPIRNGLDLLARDESYDADAVSLMRQQAEQLVRLVEDLLDVSRIMRGKVELRTAPTELVHLVRQSANAVGELIARRGQTLILTLPEEEIWLRADSVRLTQVVDNLLNNASKYSDSSGEIRLSASSGNGNAVITVQDNGMGIEPELLPRVFELFTQADRALDRSQGGLGIGLTVVQQLVELHGGRVTAQSEGLGRGSTFAVELPIDADVKKEADRIAAARTQQIESAVNFRILVVDDNVGAAWMMTKLLQKIGDHSVETAPDGPTALAKSIQFDPHVVFLDIGLPGMNGYEVARRMREGPHGGQLRLIALTGYGQDEDRRRTRQAGFDYHLVKPASIDEIEKLFAAIAANEPLKYS